MHYFHSYYLSAGHKTEVAEDMLPKYQLEIIEENSFYLGRNKNLIPNLGSKRKRKLHYQNLRLNLNLNLGLQ